MKKATVLLILLFAATLRTFAQAGDLYAGLQGGYATYYKSPLYGLNLSYTLSNPLQISLTGLMNPNIVKTVDFNHELKENLQFYSTNLDLRLFLINMETWATGPVLGGQYLYINKKDNTLGPDHLFGFNIGWHLKINLTDNIRLNGGWRYSSVKDSESYNLFYVGIGYAFNLF
jgi:hypothetical protein